MQFHRKINNKTFAATVVVGAALATAALAQMSGAPNPPTGNPFGTTNPGVPAPGKPLGHFPFASGVVSAIDEATGAITLTPMFGNAAGQTVMATGTTEVTAQKDAKISDLNVGDNVRVSGVPTGISATQITAGGSDESLMPGAFGGVKPGGAPNSSAPKGFASAQATGKISSLSPLTVTISDSVSVVLKPAPDVRITKMVTEKATDITVGDRITASGQSDANGVLTATQIRVNVDNGFGRPMPRPLPR